MEISAVAALATSQPHDKGQFCLQRQQYLKRYMALRCPNQKSRRSMVRRSRSRHGRLAAFAFLPHVFSRESKTPLDPSSGDTLARTWTWPR